MSGGHITQREAARRLGVHVNTVRAMLHDGRLLPVEVSNGSGAHGRYRHVDPRSLPADQKAAG